ncbi:MAG: M23 family metallopeptidase [Rhodospirillaceae bacterium]|nr:M23 family metallopeptidase [Rhodospirillaceae bacterium]
MREGKGLKAVLALSLWGPLWTLLAGGLCITSALAAPDPSRWTQSPGEKIEGTAPDLTQACTGALTTPLCGLKTYLACVLYDAADLCMALGLSTGPERYPGPDTLDTEVLTAPWTLPFERLMPEGFALHIYGGGLIPPSRFHGAHMTAKDGKSKTALDVINTHAPIFELLMDIPEPYVKGLVYSMSFFFRQDEQGWRIVGWSSSRAKACDVGFGTAAWAPCRWFLKNLKLRDVFAPGVTPLWASPKQQGRDDYPHPGLEIMSGMPNQPVVAPFAGTIVRRSLKYPDMPLYDWVVIQGENRQSNMMVKFAMVDRTGPMVGAKVDTAAALGEPQWVEAEHPGAGRFVHMELLRDGQQIDPRSVMRERRHDSGN